VSEFARFVVEGTGSEFDETREELSLEDTLCNDSLVSPTK
jgi:hypothetical protein